jgi:hypothetical protein
MTTCLEVPTGVGARLPRQGWAFDPCSQIGRLPRTLARVGDVGVQEDVADGHGTDRGAVDLAGHATGSLIWS